MRAPAVARSERRAGRHSRYAVAARSLLLLGVWVTLAGCSRAVEVALPSGAGSAACAAAARVWPSDVSGLSAVTTSPGSPAVRAWGDPAVIARCGVADPGPSTDCLSVDGVDWVVSTLSDGAKFVTFGRSPAIEVLIPSIHAAPGNEGSLLPVFGPAARALPTTGRSCSG